MKKSSLILGAAALMLATACSNDEVVKVAENSAAIGFSSFVNNSTRADYDTNNLPENLNVYGVSYREAEGENAAVNPFVVFNGDVVTKEGSAWTYSPLRYWIAGNDYTFAAVAPAGAASVKQEAGKVAGGIETITFTNNGEVDLLYGQKDEKGVAVNNPTVGFTLGHMLSRVRFEFVNGMNKNYSIKVKDVKITDAISEATISKLNGKDDKVWTATVGKTADFAFGMNDVYTASAASAISTHKYVIPTGSHAYTAEFTVVLYDEIAKTDVKTYAHTEVTLPAVDYVAGYSYTLKAEINDENIGTSEEDKLEPIKFNVVEVKEWENWTEKEVPGYEKTETPAEGGN